MLGQDFVETKDLRISQLGHLGLPIAPDFSVLRQLPRLQLVLGVLHDVPGSRGFLVMNQRSSVTLTLASSQVL